MSTTRRIRAHRAAAGLPVAALFSSALVVAALVGGCGVTSPASPATRASADAAGHAGSTTSGDTPYDAPPSRVAPPAEGVVPSGETEDARVVRVVDGDTIIVDRGHGSERLRYIGVNAPESVRPDSPVEFMGKEASAANAALVDGAEVVLERDISDRDRYDRLLRYVWVRDGDGWVFVNLELVRRGFAQATTYPPDVRWTDSLRAAEATARSAGLGLWGPPTPAP
jgi:endonuclease YncB( thermonuclease family)